MRERHRVRLGEAEVGEGGQRGEDLVRHLARHLTLGHARVEPGPHLLHAGGRPFGRHGLAQLVGLGRAEPGDGHRHLHQLLLEQRDAERPAQDGLEQRVQVGDLLLAPPPADVGVDGVALNGPGPDEGHLDRQVVEATRFDPGQGPHLGPALDLEDPDRVGPAQEVVDRWLLGQLGQVDATPWNWPTRSTIRCSASSMPSPSRSNFTSPMAAQSSLSHCSTLRPGMRPHSTGQTSITGRSHSTMPAEWMPRWRGRSSTSAASSATSGGIPSPPPSTAAPTASAAAAPRLTRSIPDAQPSTCSGVNPKAFPTSRTAERGR